MPAAEITAAVVADYQAGVGLKQIAWRLKISPHTIERVLEAAGVARERCTSPRRPHEAIAADYAAAIPIADICRRHGCGARTVRKIARQRGLPPRHQSDRPPPFPYDAIAADYVAGTPFAEICRRYACSDSTVKKVARLYALPRRGPFGRLPQ